MNKFFIFSLFLAAAFVIVRAVADMIRYYGRSMALGGYWQAVDDVKDRNLANSADEVIKRVQRRRNHA